MTKPEVQVRCSKRPELEVQEVRCSRRPGLEEEQERLSQEVLRISCRS